jgi:hypothetical protein
MAPPPVLVAGATERAGLAAPPPGAAERDGLATTPSGAAERAGGEDGLPSPVGPMPTALPLRERKLPLHRAAAVLNVRHLDNFQHSLIRKIITAW